MICTVHTKTHESINVQAFEYDLESNPISLQDDLYNRAYTPKPSTCFIIHNPKMREVFAVDFHDRIMHHLFYNHTYDIFKSFDILSKIAIALNGKLNIME